MSVYQKKTTRKCTHCSVEFHVKSRPSGGLTTQRYCTEKCFLEHRNQAKLASYSRTVVYRFRDLYGINLTVEEVEKLQGSPCEICGKPAGKGTRNSHKNHIDHDHKKKQVRGTLCYKCNHGIGLFMDSPELLQKAIEYLSRVR